ncbi:ABC-2 type transport system permease protein [Amycolatopsis xylanica]|uniref:ABC-2 type transport system permease protein n=1 Tax=Amycolatopsis xylanica TaxID=589385 RepID=A0A1H3SC53_9PSEU|nr:ABC-2 family transporter protein [Amycolatopsis xylanica]SDZ35258.1 ABC-2 type transport system permease protein [Amycolatopsis xylanica]
MSVLRSAVRLTALNVRARMEYRGEFALSLVHGVLWQSSLLLFLTVLVTRFPGLGGWTGGQVFFIAGLRLVGHAVYVIFFDTVADLPRLVQEGRIEGYLLRPLPLLTQVLLSSARVTALGDLAVGLTVLGIGIGIADTSWPWWKLAFLVAAVAGAALLEGAVQLAISTLAFRQVDTGTPAMWADELMASFGNYPITIFPMPLKLMLTTVLPAAYTAFLPASVLLGQTQGGVLGALAIASPAAGVLAFLAARRLWYAGAARYEGVGG